MVFDARGSFIEPHTEKRVPLGTLNVRDYLAEIRDHAVEEPDFDIWERHYPTIGPANRFGAILFVEKEGFDPLFEAVKLAQRHDLAIMSTKGMSVTASRELVEYVCGLGVPLLVLHDFDKSGFSIVGTLRRSTRRYRFGRGHASRVIDLGLRLEDIAGLETEAVYLRPSAVANLRQNGATEAEIEFLFEKRVELNAFTSRGLIDWLERKLAAHGIKKVVPDAGTLAGAYQRMRKQALVQARIDAVLAELGGDAPAVPHGLGRRIARALGEDPTIAWDEALRLIVGSDAP